MSSKQRRIANPELTPDQQAYKDGITILVHERAVVELRLSDARKRCPHVVSRDGTQDYDPEDDGGVATCAICGREFGWWCPDSPDNVCHYFTVGTQGKVKLLAGEFVTSPEHDPEYETDDRCLWCGQPNERK
jgi:hypothetical protein